MKKFYTLLIVIALLPSLIKAQCTINSALQTTPGVNPTAANLPCIERNIFYDQTLQGNIGLNDSIYPFGFPLPVRIDSVRLDSVGGLPQGITWSKSPNVLYGDSNGCVRLYGTTSALAGRYPIDGWGMAWVHITYPPLGIDSDFVVNGPLGGYSPISNYYVEVIDQGGVCHPAFSVEIGTNLLVCLNASVRVQPSIIGGTYPYSYQWASTGNQSCCNVFSDWGVPSITMNSTVSVTVTDANNNIATDFVNLVVSPPSFSNYQITTSGPTRFCTGSVTLDAGSGFASYAWSNFTFNRTLTTSQSGTYIVNVAEANSCIYIDTVIVTANASFSGQQVCAVTVDPLSGKNMVVWEKAGVHGVDSFKVFKETSVTGVYQLMSAQTFLSFSTFEDLQSNPAQQSERYVITTKDGCGESVHSISHKTIHLSSNIGINNVINLNWNAYEGFTYPSFNIYRGTSSSNMTLLAQVSSSTLSYTDLSPPAPPVYYQIEVINPAGCVPSAKTASFSSSLSNVININALGISATDKDEFKVTALYDDNSGKNMLRFSSATEMPLNVKLFDCSGREIFRTDRISQPDLALPDYIVRGVYVAEVARESKSYHIKVLIR
ncbi:MAG: hypothetical protein V4615_05910 [Bacteroidota bacterium]